MPARGWKPLRRRITVLPTFFSPPPSGSSWQARGLQHRRPAPEGAAADSGRARARYGFARTRTDEEVPQLRQWIARYKPDQNVRVISQLP